MRYSLVLIAVLTLPACQTLKSSWRFADTFTVDGLTAGSVMDEVDCHWPDTALWVAADGQGECVRYFHAGLSRQTGQAHIWFHDDRLAAVRDGGRVIETAYRNNDPNTLAATARREFQLFGLPYIRYSRPGTYGSSGNHKLRRRGRDAKIVSAAMDALKTRYGITEFLLSGQGGGGHLVAAVLEHRTDVRCAVITSGVVAVKFRMGLRGWASDATGRTDAYDPFDHVGSLPKDPERRILIVADRMDALVPFTTQTDYFRALRAAGHKAWLIEAKGRGGNHHQLARAGFRLAKWCGAGDDVTMMRARLTAWQAAGH